MPVELKQIKEVMSEVNEEMKEITSEIKEGQGEIKKEVDKHGKTLADVQDDVVKLDNRKAELEEKMKGLEQEMVKAKRLGKGGEKQKRDFGFKNTGEFVAACISNSKDNPKDDRLKEVSDYMKKELATDPGSAGGFIIPPQFGDMLPMFEPQDSIFRPDATVIPSGDPPEAEITFPALDQSGSKGVYAGVEVDWIEEGGSKPETDYQYRDIKLKPKEVAAYIPVSDKMLRNAPGSAGTINMLLTWALAQAEDDAFMNGTGQGQPLGLLEHASNILQTREVANEIDYLDVVNMFSQIIFGGSYKWVTSQTSLPQLMTMEDTAGQLIWQPNAREGSPGSLLGLPVEVSERQPTLGNTGDLGIVDLMYYYIKDGVGPIIASSEHVEFKKNKTLVKAFMSVDGQPAITTPLEQENGEEVSPFVFLDSATE